MNASECPICGSPSKKVFTTAYVDVHQCSCSSCGHLFAKNPKPNAGVHEHDKVDIEIFRRRNEALIKKLLGGGYIKDAARILDIGAGLGHIVSELKQRVPNVQITCVEAAPMAVRHLKNCGFDVLEDIETLQPVRVGYFDFIFMVELIEHIHDPVSLLSSCRSVLAPGGQIFLTTPCGELRDGSHKTAAYEIPEHIQFFTQRSLRLAATKANFSEVRYVEMPEFHAGSNFKPIKFLKDYARTLRNFIQGKHHLVAFIK